MKPLYCFKLIHNDDEPIHVIKYEIPTWHTRAKGPYRFEYEFAGKLIGKSYRIFSITNDKIDRLVNDRLFTFDPDQDHAEALIKTHILRRISDTQIKAEKSISKWRGVLNRWNQLQPDYLCPEGCTDCVLDPMYIFKHHPEWYKSMYGDKTPQEVVKETCMQRIHEWSDGRCHDYDDEDK